MIKKLQSYNNEEENPKNAGEVKNPSMERYRKDTKLESAR